MPFFQTHIHSYTWDVYIYKPAYYRHPLSEKGVAHTHTHSHNAFLRHVRPQKGLKRWWERETGRGNAVFLDIIFLFLQLQGWVCAKKGGKRGGWVEGRLLLIACSNKGMEWRGVAGYKKGRKRTCCAAQCISNPPIFSSSAFPFFS